MKKKILVIVMSILMIFGVFAACGKNKPNDTPPTPVDKTQLSALITEVEALTESDYTVESWSVLQISLTAAKTVVADTEATQAQVDTAKNNLGAAKEALMKKLFADSAATESLLRSVQIANNTIWKYSDYDVWKATGVINPAPKYNIQTDMRVGANYNCYEYTNIIEMLVTAMKALKEVKDLPGANSAYTEMFNFYEQLAWDATYTTLPYYQGTTVVTSSTQSEKEWKHIIGVNRQPNTYPENGRTVLDKANVYDDQMWIIRCFLELYHVLDGETARSFEPVEGYYQGSTPTTDRRTWYLDYAEYLTIYCLDGWDQSKRSNGTEWGGITWGPGYESKHTCSNGPIIAPLVWLAEIYKDSGETISWLKRGGYNTGLDAVTEVTTNKGDYYLDYAKKVYDFCYGNLKRGDDAYGDLIGATTTTPTTGPNAGLRTTTAHGGLDTTAYPYNCGSPLSGAAELYRVTKLARYQEEAVATADAAFSTFGIADSKVENGVSYYSFRQNSTGKAEYDSCLLRAWVECYTYGVYDTSFQLNEFSKTLNYAYDNYYRDGFLPMDFLNGWNFGMVASDAYDNKDDVRVSSLRTFNYSAQFSWIALAEFHKLAN